ncbi:MAG TPA: hypothetical protein VL381_05695 [Rhodocyclaceae bacterium]|jgi:hypothetical protein|nr:hypothetical protein [Rhodocyclaceae bacterium]
MKKVQTLLLTLPLIFALGACNKGPEPVLSNNKDSIKDATDSRPHEKTRDAIEDAGDSAKQAGKDLKDAVKGESK